MRPSRIRTITVACMMIALATGAHAQSARDPGIPQREYDLGIVSKRPTEGRLSRVPSAQVNSQRDRDIYGQGEVNQYDFSRGGGGSRSSTGSTRRTDQSQSSDYR